MAHNKFYKVDQRAQTALGARSHICWYSGYLASKTPVPFYLHWFTLKWEEKSSSDIPSILSEKRLLIEIDVKSRGQALNSKHRPKARLRTVSTQLKFLWEKRSFNTLWKLCVHRMCALNFYYLYWKPVDNSTLCNFHVDVDNFSDNRKQLSRDCIQTGVQSTHFRSRAV